MNVLHVLNSSGGGATASILELVRASRRAGTGLRHFAVYPGTPARQSREIHDTFHDAEAIPLPGWNVNPGMDRFRRFAGDLATARRTALGARTRSALNRALDRWEVDLVTTNCAANIHGALAARRRGLPHLWHIRERIGAGGSMHFPVDDASLVQRIASLSSALATVSEYVAEPFRAHGVDRPLRVVYDGVHVDAFRSSDAGKRGRSLREVWKVPEDAVLVGKVAGVTSSVKRHDLFLRAAAEVAQRHRNVRFVVVGALPRPGGWRRRPAYDRWRELAALGHELGLGKRLIWAGFVEDPPAVMRAIDILAHACDIEGFPRVVIEAMAAGTPVVGPRAGGVAEGAGEAGLLVEPGSPQALASGIEALLADPERRSRLSRAGRARVSARFSMERHLADMVELYRRVAGGNECERAGTFRPVVEVSTVGEPVGRGASSGSR